MDVSWIPGFGEKIAISSIGKWLASRPFWVWASLLLVGWLVYHQAATLQFLAIHPECAPALLLVALLGGAAFYFNAQHRKTGLALHRTCQAADQIVQHTHPNWPRKTILSAKSTRFIKKNYDGEVTRIYEIKAVEPVGLWEVNLAVTDAGRPAAYLGDLRFQATVDGRPMPYVQSENSPRRKRVVLFFLPQMKKDEVRTVRLDYIWPGMYAGLEPFRIGRSIGGPGEERFRFKLSGQSVDPVPVAEFKILAAPEIGPLVSTLLGSPPGATLTHQLLGILNEWTLNVPNADGDYEMLLSRPKAK